MELCLSCCVAGESKTDTYDGSKLNKVDNTNDLMEYLDRGESAVVCNKWTFERSWEVANKVGGIYTVIHSKGSPVEELKEYARVEVEDLEFPAGLLNNAVSKLRDLVFRIHTGRWYVAGNPLVILFDIGSASCNLDQYKQTLFEKSGIGIPHEDIESNDAQECGRKMYEAFHRGGIPENNKLLSQDDIMKIKRLLYASQRSSLPPITTHNIVDDLGDPVLNNLRRCQLFNSRNDRVKVIFHPEFLSSTSRLLGLDYEDFVRGCRLGIFPKDSISQLVNYMHDFTRLNRRQRIAQGIKTERLCDLLDWRTIAVYYRRAMQMALNKVYPELVVEKERNIQHIKNPRLISEPPSPASSRAIIPTASYSDEEIDDEFGELGHKVTKVFLV
ncbi:hypothetical protein QYM36_004841 [Artemia franciscana]|uniref:Glycogen [starch] synthase n=1 Tax=Artemia franciscana TaxID=6661 RepID=A0AA88LAL7_ARTSF|nr:hypothetical protein QYM36_004841 [Artemia franciscana]